MDRKKEILILGAGPAGLSAGWKLAEKGFRVRVLEKEPRVGGQCATVEKDSYRFDFGGHRFITSDQNLAGEITALLDGELISTPRKSQIRLFNRFFDYPLQIKNLVKGMNPLFSAFCFLDYLFYLGRRKIFHPPEVSFEDWVKNRFGASLYRIFFGVYTKKLWGVSPKMISADWAAQRITIINLSDVLLRLAGKKSNAPKTYALKFLYPKFGIGRIADKMAERIAACGGDISLDSGVEKIIHNDGRIQQIAFRQGNQLRGISADSYVNTIPLPEFIQKLSPQPEERYLRAARKIKFRSVRFMNIIFDLPRISGNTWIYVPEPKYIFFRIQETRNWSPHLVPDPGKTALILEIACFEGDELWRKQEHELCELCLRDLRKLGLLPAQAKALRYFSTRLQDAYPIYDLGYRQNVETCLELVRGMDNLISIGRQGLFRYNNMDHSIKMGILTAEHIERGNLETKIFSIASEKEAFEAEKDTKDRE